MYIDKYTINSYGNEYKGNKTLKNQLLTTVKSKDGNRLKKMIPFLEEYEELNSPYNSEIELNCVSLDAAPAPDPTAVYKPFSDAVL